MRSGLPSGEVRDGSDDRRPDLGGRMLVGPVIAARMVAQCGGAFERRDRPAAEVDFRKRAADRLRHGEEPPRRFGRTDRYTRHPAGRRPRPFRFWMREREETARFLGHVPEVDQAKRLADDVEKISMFARCAVRPLARRTLGGVPQTDIERAAGAVLDIPDQPVVSGAFAGREIFAAHRLGLPAETACQFGSIVAGHHAASRSEIRSTGQRSNSLPRTAGPLASTGTNILSFHEMISWNRP